jgi:hypothetical protein
MNLRACPGFFAMTLLLCCGGTETSNPIDPGQPTPTLTRFVGSGCKKETPAAASAQSVHRSGGDTARVSQALDVGALAGETVGLRCVAWETVAPDTLSVALINFDGACGAQWKGAAKFDAQGLTLGLVNPLCMIAACGTCIYDWTFDVHLATPSAPLPVAIQIDTCPGTQPIQTTTVSLPVDTAPSGIVCNYAEFGALGWQAMALGTCGTVGMPCNGTSMCSSSVTPPAPPCTAGLTCTAGQSADKTICAKPCTVEADCGTSGAQTCTAGLCRPKTPW